MDSKKQTKLESLIAQHDLTYTYTDDRAAYRRGADEYDEIIKLSEQLDETEVNKIWNHWVDKKIAKQFRNDWYWGVK